MSTGKTLLFSMVLGGSVAAPFLSSLGMTERKVKELGGSLRDLKKQDGYKLGQGLEDLRAKSVKSVGALRKSKRELENLNAQAERAGKITPRLGREIELVEARIVRQERAVRKNSRALERQVFAIQKSGRSVAAVREEHRRFGRQVDETTRKMDRLSDLQKRHEKVLDKREQRRGQMVDAAALGYMVASPIGRHFKVEAAEGDLKKATDGTVAQYRKIKSEMMDLSEYTGMATTSLYGIGAVAGRSGIELGNITNFTRDAAEMSVAFDMMGEEAGSTMIGLRTQLQLNQKEVIRLGDAVNYLDNNMDATAKGIVNVMNRSAASGKMIGLTGQQVGAFAATLLALKMPQEIAGTAMNAFFTKLSTADKQGAKFQQALANIGMSAEELKSGLEQDAQGTILRFLESLKGSDDVMGNAFEIFGMEYVDDMTKLLGGLGEYKKALSLVSDENKYAGAMHDEFMKKKAQDQAKWKEFTESVGNLGATIGGVLAPPLMEVVGVLGSGASWLRKFAEEHPVLAKGVGLVVTGLVGMTVAGTAFGYLLTFLHGGVLGYKRVLVMAATTEGRAAALKKVLAVRTMALGAAQKAYALGSTLVVGALKGMVLGFNLLKVAVMTNPIGFVIGGLALAAGYLISQWQPARDFFVSMWEQIGNGVSWVWEKITGLWESIKSIPILGKMLEYSPLGLIGKGVGWLMGGDDSPKPGSVVEGDPDVVKDQGGWFSSSSSSQSVSSGDVHVTVNQTFNVNGADGSSVKTSVEAGSRGLKEAVRRAIDEYFAEQKRLGYV